MLVGQGALRALSPARTQGQARRPRAGSKPRALRHRGPGRLGPHDRGQRRPRLRRAVPRVRAAFWWGCVRTVSVYCKSVLIKVKIKLIFMIFVVGLVYM